MSEGELDFDVPAAGKACKTWYRVVGDLKAENKTPLIVCHGGPGCSHDYLMPVADLAKLYGIPVILYDQIGNGRSTHLQEKKGDISFWTTELFFDELANLIDKLGIRERGYDLLGHSWGGMLVATYASTKPQGLRRIVVSNSPACIEDWLAAANKLRAAMPEVDAQLKKHEDAGTTECEEYEKWVDVFYRAHVCRMDPWPSEMHVLMEGLKEDNTVYLTMNGPSEFHVIGPLRDFSITDRLHLITSPTLLLNGGHDEATDETLYPYFRRVSGPVKWRTLERSAHMCHIEQRAEYMGIVGEFLG